jgi:hypothetical protein
MVASGSRTMIAGSLSSSIAGFRQSCRFSQSSDPSVGTGPAFAATGVGSQARREGDRRLRQSFQISAGYDPPSRWRFWPDMKPAKVLQRNAQVAPNSLGSPSRLAAIASI